MVFFLFICYNNRDRRVGVKMLIKMWFLLLLITVPLYSQEEVSLANLKAEYYNSFFTKILETTLQITGFTRDEENFTAIYFSKYAALFSKEQRIELVAALQKYKEWQEIAVDNKVEHTKDIATFSITAVADTESDRQADNPNLTIRFVSNSVTDHVLFFIFYETSTKNIFVKMKPDDFSLDYKNAVLLE